MSLSGAMKRIIVLLPFILGSQRSQAGPSICPNQCSNQGICSNTSVGECLCFPGFHGVDCSLRLCHAGKAWVDLPSASDVAHAEYTECSNMGNCDRATGTCKCRAGFGGPACDVLLCPYTDVSNCIDGVSSRECGLKNVCSGHGRCLSLRESTRLQDFNDYSSYSAYYEYDDWDADMIHGCACEDGWEGPACDLKSCPKGDDPQTAGQDEVQLIDCDCITCIGGLFISFRGARTRLIPYDADETLARFYFNELSTIEEAEFQIVGGETVCGDSGSTVQITFKLPQGDQPDLVVEKGAGLRADIDVITDGAHSKNTFGVKSFRGTREHIECSNHGVCDRETGICKCYELYDSSDGFGNFGPRMDCGYRFADSFSYTSNGTNLTSSCPVLSGAVCSGNGYCSSDGVCICNTGFEGGGCEDLSCGTANAWFGDVGLQHANTFECAGIGVCDHTTGLCTRCGGDTGVFSGTRCQHLGCSTDSNGNECSSNGRCLSLRDIAPITYNPQKEIAGYTYTSSWDADMIKGCACDRTVSIDGAYQDPDPGFDEFYPYTTAAAHFFNTTYDPIFGYQNSSTFFNISSRDRYYRGPYANAVTDFRGFDCSQSFCPKGDDPQTSYDRNEIQKLECAANNGTFTIMFRENVTLPIAFNETTSFLAHRLRQLYTVRAIEVSFDAAGNSSLDAVCSESGQALLIEFQSEFGDLPLMIPDTTNLFLNGVSPPQLVNITESQRGSKEDAECSRRGLCDEASGICTCAEGFSSSNGSTDFHGDTGDCSYFNPFFTLKKR